MLARSIARVMLCFTLLAAAATSAFAAPLTFNFKFLDPVSGATATGFITFESTLLVNPGNNVFALPDPAVLELQATVSGAAAGNGTFGIGSFNQVIFDTTATGLDLRRQLVGQPTSGAAWGTPDGTSGDFNLFAAAPGPNGMWYFTLQSNGGAGAEPMVLSTMIAAGNVPTLGEWGMVILSLLLGLGAWVAMRRQGSKSAV